MKVLGKVICALSLAVIIWGFVSWCDIVADNCEPNPVHSPYNMFVLLTENF